jgi:hypothetical protein
MEKAMIDRCPACDRSSATETVIEIGNQPVLANRPYPSRDEARSVPRRPVRVAWCAGCGHLFNPAFDPDLVTYDPHYSNPLHYSAVFRAYAERLVQRLVSTHSLVGAHAVEFGSGDGSFLGMLKGSGLGSGTGIDPAAPDSQVLGEVPGAVPPRIVVMRHVLEHLDRPWSMLRDAHALLAPEGVVYVEVPNGEHIMEHGAVWDLVYEHPSLFVGQSLRFLMQRAGFTVQRMAAEYSGQFLSVDAVVEDTSSDLVYASLGTGLPAEVRRFVAVSQGRMDAVEACLGRAQREGRSVVVWGAGSKGITLAALFEDHPALVAAVDLNPRKQGMYLAGSGLAVRSPALGLNDADEVLLPNPIYEAEVRAIMAAEGSEAELILA